MKKQFVVIALVLAGCIGPRPDGPSPAPRPDGDAKSLIIMTVDEYGKREAGSILSDLDYWQDLEKRGHSFKIRDVKDSSKYAPLYKKTGPPCVLFWEKPSKKFLGVDKIPSGCTHDQMDDIVKKYTRS